MNNENMYAKPEIKSKVDSLLDAIRGLEGSKGVFLDCDDKTRNVQFTMNVSGKITSKDHYEPLILAKFADAISSITSSSSVLVVLDKTVAGVQIFKVCGAVLGNNRWRGSSAKYLKKQCGADSIGKQLLVIPDVEIIDFPVMDITIGDNAKEEFTDFPKRHN